jgi:hypothetical protein
MHKLSTVYTNITESTLCGLYDIKSSKVITSTNYDSIRYSPASNLYYVTLKGKCGLLNTNGKYVVPLGSFDSILSCDSSTPVVNKNGKYGIINAKGKLIVPIIYNDIYRENSVAIVRKGKKYGLVNANSGKIIKPIEYSSGGIYNGISCLVKDSICTIFDSTGKTIVSSTTYEFYRATSNLIYVKKDDKLGAINMKGNLVVPFNSTYYLFETHNDLAVFGDETRRGVLGKTGEIIIQLDKYDTINFRYDGYIQVTKAGNFGLIDSNGNIVLDCNYSCIGDMNNNRIVVCKDNRFAVLDKNGTEIIPFGVFDEIAYAISDNVVAVKKNNLYGYVSIKS